MLTHEQAEFLSHGRVIKQVCKTCPYQSTCETFDPCNHPIVLMNCDGDEYDDEVISLLHPALHDTYEKSSIEYSSISEKMLKGHNITMRNIDESGLFPVDTINNLNITWQSGVFN